MCKTPTLKVKNTFLCIEEEASPIVQTRARAKTADAAASLEDWPLEIEAEAETADSSEGGSRYLRGDSGSSLEYDFDDQANDKSVQCVVKNTFLCVAEDLSPVNLTRARAKTAHATVTFEEEEEDEDATGAPVMVHVETNWEYGEMSASVSNVTSRQLCLDDEGSCLAAQEAIEGGASAERQPLLQDLRGRVREAARSACAHKVLQSVILFTSVEDSAFIAEELQGLGCEGLLDAHTCSVVCCLLARAPSDVQTVALVDELLAGNLGTMCCHKSGHELAAAILANCIPRQVARVMGALHCNPQRYARHRFASKVVVAALRTWCSEGSDSLARELLAQPGTVVSLACHNFGVHVVRALLASPRHSRQVMHFLLKTLRRLSKDKYGRELMCELGYAPAMSAA